MRTKPAPQLMLLQADLAAVLELAGALSAWQAEICLASMTPPEDLVPMQMSLLLECKLQLCLMPNAQVRIHNMFCHHTVILIILHGVYQYLVERSWENCLSL